MPVFNTYQKSHNIYDCFLYRGGISGSGFNKQGVGDAQGTGNPQGDGETTGGVVPLFMQVAMLLAVGLTMEYLDSEQMMRVHVWHMLLSAFQGPFHTNLLGRRAGRGQGPRFALFGFGKT